tara:strand:- start:775 stop:978 length:204 start_codon:yes stop_codon:yes gene_type:complete
MVEIIRKDTGEVCMLADPGGVFTTHAKLLSTRKELQTERVSIVSRDTWDFLRTHYEVESIHLTKRDK